MNHPATSPTVPSRPRYCGHCGGDLLEEPYDGGAIPPSYARHGGTRQGNAAQAGVHHECARRLEMEPPRYCSECRRRLKVQVSPLGWRAECSRHGATAG